MAEGFEGRGGDGRRSGEGKSGAAFEVRCEWRSGGGSS
jgi:hypothetical protein